MINNYRMLQYLVLIFVAMDSAIMGQHFQPGNGGYYIDIDSSEYNEGNQNEYTNSIVVLSGIGKRSDVINLNGQKCDPLPKFPFEITFATGMFFNESITLCGGQQSTYLASKKEIKTRTIEQCFTLKNGLWDTSITMLKKRSMAKSIVVGKDLWITGGANLQEIYHYVDKKHFVVDDIHFDMFNDSEMISENGSQKLGPLLPPNHECHSNGTLINHNLVSINETHTLLIGGECVSNGIGDDTSTKSTFYYDHLNQLWSQGPDMMSTFDTIAGAGAGIIVDKITGVKNVIVVHGGGQTEILKVGTNKWTDGPILIPDGHLYLTTFFLDPLTIAMEEEFFVFGGFILDLIHFDVLPNYIMYKMACENDKCLWSKTSVQLSHTYEPFLVAISVPNEVLNCK